jgi:hypothetical protein
MLCHASDVTSFLSGEYTQRPNRRPEILSGEQLIAAAKHRETIRKAKRKGEEERKLTAAERSRAMSAEAEASEISNAFMKRPNPKWGSENTALDTPPPRLRARHRQRHTNALRPSTHIPRSTCAISTSCALYFL